MSKIGIVIDNRFHILSPFLHSQVCGQTGVFVSSVLGQVPYFTGYIIS